MEKENIRYQHTQVGRLMIATLLLVVLMFLYILGLANFDSIILVIMFVVLLLIASFVSLNVKIDEEYIRIKFGYGIFRKKFSLKEINSVQSIKNHWYYGWGIRYWFWPRMWIFNVSGFDAVEIKMKNGRIYRIGTDEPKELEYAISQAINKE